MNFLFINEIPLDKNAHASLIFKLIYKNESKIINHENDYNEEIEIENYSLKKIILNQN